MPKIRKCPDCEMVLNEGAHACGCGWREEGYKAVGYPLGYRQCDWRSNNLRCKYPGTISRGVQGDQPWYCSLHYECEGGLFGDQIVTASQEYRHWTAVEREDALQAEAVKFCADMGLETVTDMRQYVRKITSEIAKRMTGPGNTAWATKIMDRLGNGEKVGFRSEELARDALGLPREREPGEDG